MGIQHKKLTQNQVTAAMLDPTVFTHYHCWIRDKSGKPVRFQLWDFQRAVLECFDDEPRVLVLKARQLGISWLADSYALWLCTANQGQTVMILSQGQRESKEEMRRIRFMHERLPPELRRRTGVQVSSAHTPDTTEHLEFPDMDSRIVSLPSTEHAGTSYTATLVIIHELAKINTAATLIPSITPTMADSGRMLIVSTAFGYSGTFYDYWKEHGVRWHTGQIVGDKGEQGDFRPVFIPWHARPGRDQKWYDATARALKEGAMKQEYPSCLTAETLISTNRGIIPIVEAQVGDITESGEVIACGPQPIDIVYKLTTTQGRVIRGTGDHPVFTPSDGFIGLADLQPGQEITLCPPRFADEPYVVHLDSIPGVDRSVVVDERWGRFLGYFAGDGSVYGAGQIGVVCDAQDIDTIADVYSLLLALIGEPAAREIQHGPASSHRPDNGAVELRVHRKEALEVLVALGAANYNSTQGSSRRRVSVPDAIFRSPQNVVREFLRGLFEADGSASGGSVRWGSSKQILVEQVQLLMLGFGINAPISARHYKRKIGNNLEAAEYKFWWLNFATEAANLFFDHIGFISERKNNSYDRPFALPSTDKRVKRNKMVDAVAEVTWDNMEVTYDLTVESEHIFSANGILTHNTPAEAFQGSMVACFADQFDRHKHAIDATRHHGSIYDTVHGMDLGINYAYSYLIEVQGATAFIYDEICLRDDTVEALGKATIERDEYHGLDPTEIVSYVDPAGVARNMQTLKTDFDVLQESGLLVDQQADKVAPSQRVDIMKKLLKAGRLWISLDCPDLIEAFEKAQWKRRRGPGGVMIQEDTYEKDGKYEHTLDACGYALCRIFPPDIAAATSVGGGRMSASGPGPAAVAVGGVASYSGSEFGG